MLTVDCKDVLSIQNELLVYVADQVAAIPTLKNHQFVLSTLEDDEIIDNDTVITAIKEYLDSIGEGRNFAVISNLDTISINQFMGNLLIEKEVPIDLKCFLVLIVDLLPNIKLNLMSICVFIICKIFLFYNLTDQKRSHLKLFHFLYLGLQQDVYKH